MLGACVTSLAGEKETVWSIRVVQATLIAPSLWPILFSGVVGNAVRAFADWRIERGILLMVQAPLVCGFSYEANR